MYISNAHSYTILYIYSSNHNTWTQYIQIKLKSEFFIKQSIQISIPCRRRNLYQLEMIWNNFNCKTFLLSVHSLIFVIPLSEYVPQFISYYIHNDASRYNDKMQWVNIKSRQFDIMSIWNHVQISTRYNNIIQ